MSMAIEEAQTADLRAELFEDVPRKDSVVPLKNTINSSVAVLCATTLGAGILSLPYAFSLVGLVLGLVLLLFVGVVSRYAIDILVRAAIIARATSYEQLGEIAIPHVGGRLVVGATLLLIAGSLTAFLVIIGDTVTPAVSALGSFTDSPWYVSHNFLLFLVLVVLIYPMCLLREIHALEKVAKFAVFIILMFSVLVVVLSCRAINLNNVHMDTVSFGTVDTNFFEALPIISLAFTCQTMVFPLWRDLRAPSSRRMLSVVSRSLVLSGLLYAAVGLFGYIQYSSDTKDDALSNLSDANGFQAVRLIFAIAIVIHYPVVHFAFRDTLLRAFKINAYDAPVFVHVGVTTAMCGATLGLAILIPKLSAVFSFTGALCAFPYCFIFPPIFYLRVRRFGFHPPPHDDLSSEIEQAEQADVTDEEAAKMKEREEQGADGNESGAPVIFSICGRVDTSVSMNGPPDGSNINESENNNDGEAGLLLHTHVPLTLGDKIRVYSLLAGSSVACIISIVVTFKDMLQTLEK